MMRCFLGSGVYSKKVEYISIRKIRIFCRQAVYFKCERFFFLFMKIKDVFQPLFFAVLYSLHVGILWNDDLAWNPNSSTYYTYWKNLNIAATMDFPQAVYIVRSSDECRFHYIDF